MNPRSADKGSDPRVRRDKSKDEVIKSYMDPKDGLFTEIRQVLTFAASLGVARDRREPIKSQGESVRWDTFTGVPGVESLVGMIALVSVNDREVVDSARLKEQLEIFEEFANGGLSILRDELENTSRLAREVVLELVLKELRAGEGGHADPLQLLTEPAK